MKRFLFSIILLITLPLAIVAQDGNAKTDAQRKAEHEDFLAQRAAFITQQVGLSSSEAETFWPLYNERSNQLNEVMRERNRSMYLLRKDVFPREIGNSAKGGTQEVYNPESNKVNEYLNTYMNSFTKELNIKNSYHKKFLTILSAEKVARLYIAEDRFEDKMIRDFIAKKIAEKQ